MHSFYLLFGIGFAGALGTLARYGTGYAAAACFGNGYPYGTVIVNILGSFLFGILSGLLPASLAEWRLILLTGFLGGFTTFSAFAFENYSLLEHHRYAAFSINILGQNIFGIAAVLAGFILAARH